MSSTFTSHTPSKYLTQSGQPPYISILLNLSSSDDYDSGSYSDSDSNYNIQLIEQIKDIAGNNKLSTTSLNNNDI